MFTKSVVLKKSTSKNHSWNFWLNTKTCQIRTRQKDQFINSDFQSYHSYSCALFGMISAIKFPGIPWQDDLPDTADKPEEFLLRTVLFLTEPERSRNKPEQHPKHHQV